MNDPALLELFHRLKEAGLPLGLGEYHLLLQALSAGFGSRDRNALAQLCCTLWIKSEDEKRIFQEYFEQLIPKQYSSHILQNSIKGIRLDTSQEKRKILKNLKPFLTHHYLILRVISSLFLGGISFVILRNSRPIIPNPGVLTFRTIVPFSNFVGSFKENENAVIRIARIGGSRGEVSATAIIDKIEGNYQEDDHRQLKVYFPNKVTFDNNEVGVKNFTIPILNDDNEDNEEVTLRLIEPQGGVKIEGNGTATFTVIDDDRKWFNSWDWLLIVIAFLLFLLISMKTRSVQRMTSTSDDETPENDTGFPRTILSSEVSLVMTDEIQIAKAIKQSNNQVEENFPILTKDLPVTYRQIKQRWRHLRRLVREGVPTELDLEATIQHIGRQGFLLNPVLTPRRINKIELLLLIDQDGSMVPFHHFSQVLLETASRAGRFHQVRAYYFHNCPNEYLYKDPYHLEAEPIDDCLLQLPKTRVVCLIFSDAGAARGGFNSRRRRLTKFFLKQLKQHVRHIAWLNPVPRTRWEDTTAAEIANLVPMFEVNRQELYRAIDTLRGRYLRSDSTTP